MSVDREKFLKDISPFRDKDDFSEKMIELMAKYNTSSFTLSKFNEELFELGEVVNKYINKSEIYRPPLDDIKMEFGDVLFRFVGFLYMILGHKEAVNKFLNEAFDHVETKAEKCYRYLVEKRFDQGI